MNMIMPLVKADGKAEYALLEQLTSRSGEVDRKVTAAVSAILDGVRSRGDDALLEYTRQFDGVDPVLEPVGRDRLGELAAACDPGVYAALERAAANIADFHRRQLQQSWLDTRKDGTIVGQRVRGLARVGIYVPGGTAAYPSSVLMNAIPARIAGVEEIIMVTPPPKNGGFNPDVMAAAYIAGVDAVYLVGRCPGRRGPGLRHRLGSAGGQDRRSRQYLRGDRETVGLRAGGHRYGGGTE